MGYRTYHELEVINGNPEIDYLAEISKISGYWNVFDGEQYKWYNHELDMRVVSERHPGVLFKLKGEGEESDDIWIEYHKNGLMQREKAVITFEEFNESKLK